MQVRTSLTLPYERHSAISANAQMLSLGWVEQVQKTSLEQVLTVFFHCLSGEVVSKLSF